MAVDCDGEVATPLERLPTATSAPSPRRPLARGSLVFRGRGLVAGLELPISSSRTKDGYRLRIARLATFEVAGSSILCHRVQRAADRELLVRAACGPPLVLALALQGAYCLHASAVCRDGVAVAFLGPAGTGKSSLARSLVASELDWSLLADDVLPVELASGRLLSLPCFPQLKLTADAQPWLNQPDRLPLAAAYLLDGHAQEAEVRVSRLSPIESVLAVLSRTVASRLFAADMHRHHLGFAVESASATRWASLSYDWERCPTSAIDVAIRGHLEGSATARLGQAPLPRAAASALARVRRSNGLRRKRICPSRACWSRTSSSE